LKLAIIVPYRNRETHLTQFVSHMTAYLNGKDYEIHVIEQADDKPFNRGALLNAGVYMAPNFDYYVTHDVDMLPIKVDYSYPMEVTHLAGRAEQFNYKLPYSGYCGGVVSFTYSQFDRIGGYPNDFWGWGGEDDAFLLGLKNAGLELHRTQGEFRSLAHEKVREGREINRQKFKQGRKRNDGFGCTWFRPIQFEIRDGYILKKVRL
jgi:beta-1,4-galactosyltransferase 2